MKYIELDVRTATVVHGYDENNREIVEHVDEQEYATKLISIDRIQSITERYLLATSSHGRVMYWEYDSTFEALRKRLEDAGLVVA